MPAQARRPAPPAQAPATSSIDPVKLLMKYMWVLAASVFVGAVVGGIAHFLLINYHPFWRASVIYQVYEPQTSIGDGPALGTGTEDELARFMATQISIMKSERVLAKAAGDPRLKKEAPRWVRRFIEDPVRKPDGTIDLDASLVDVPDAAIELMDTIQAHVIPGTELMELSLTWRQKEDVAGVVSIVNDAYLADLRLQARQQANEEGDALQKTVQNLEDEMEVLSRRRAALLKEQGIDSLDERVGATQQAISLATEQISELKAAIESTVAELDSLEGELRAASGPTFPDTMRQEIEQSPLILNMKQAIQQTESQLNMLRERGFGPNHRDVRNLVAQIAGAEQKLQEQREKLLMDAFQARIDGYRQLLRSYRAQEADILARLEVDKTRMNDLLRLQTVIADMSSEIERLAELRQEYNDRLANYNARNSLKRADRVTVLQAPKVPTEMSFPRLTIMVPVGVIAIVGLTGGIILLRELLDQRVRSASDIALIPRTRVVGVVPHASEDPAQPKSVEAVFTDHPRCAIAESFRQIRAAVVKRMQEAGHRSLLVVSSMPESGATTVLWNLATASASADQRVLVIDANFRRPKLHVVGGVSDSPGLSDVLAGGHTMESAVQRSETGVDVLSAGSREQRVFERLAADRMRVLIADAGAKYDLVLVDVAPAIVSGDAFELANRCDASMLVARALSEKRGLVARIKNQLEDSRADFFGVVVNGVRSSAGGYIKRNIRTTHRYQNGA